jgi:hypothetical protein
MSLTGAVDARPSGNVDVADVLPGSTKFTIEVCGPSHARRFEAERLIKERFELTHAARIRTFMPSLLLYVDSHDELKGVAGARPAADGALFLERYLQGPIESEIALRTGAKVQRGQIVEIGNFACLKPHVATRFVAALPRFLIGQGHTWVTFTATSSVRRILKCLGARCVDLGRAEGACAGRGGDDWGRYYDNDPHVMAGFLPLARRISSLWVGIREN